MSHPAEAVPGRPRPAPPGLGADVSSPSALGRVLRPVRNAVVLACVLRAVGTVAGIVPFAVVAELARTPMSAPVDRDRAWSIVVVAALAPLVRLALTVGATALTHFADVDFQLSVRRQIAARLSRVPLGWFTVRRAGEVTKALNDDVEAMHHLVGHGYLNLTSAVVTPVSCIAYLVTIDWRPARAFGPRAEKRALRSRAARDSHQRAERRGETTCSLPMNARGHHRG